MMKTIMHITDTHAYAAGIAAAATASGLAADAYVHTGDIVRDCYDDDTGGALDTKFCPVIGNHDAITREGTQVRPYYDWTQQPTQEQLRAKFFPNPSKYGIELADGGTWWKKDLDEMLLLGLNFTARGEAFSAQSEWLRAVLDACLHEGKPVVVASHDGNDSVGLSFVQCPWTAAYWENTDYRDASFDELYPFIAASREMVQDFKTRGGTVLLWIYGHSHADGFSTTGGFPQIVLGSTIADQYNDVYRSSGGRTGACVVNRYEIDLEAKSLTVYRLGADVTYTGRWRRMLAYNYESGKVSFA